MSLHCEIRMLRYWLGYTLEEHKTNESIRQKAKVMNSGLDTSCRREKEDDIRRVHVMKVAGKRNRGHQSMDGMILSEKTSNPVPSMKRRLRKGLGGGELGLRQPPATRTGQSGDR